MSNRKRMLSTAVAFACVGLAYGSSADGSVLQSETGPISTLNDTINFTLEGTIDWKYYGGITTTVSSYAGNEKAGMNLFSNISTGTPGGTVGKGSGASYEADILYTNGTNPTNGGAANANEAYLKSGSGGESFNYSMPAYTTETFRLYLESYDALGTVTVTSAASGLLYQNATPVALATAPNGNGTAGSGNASGLFTFTINNSSGSTDSLTFNAKVATTVGSSSSVGVEGITVAGVNSLLTVPSATVYDLQSSSPTVSGITDAGTAGGTIGSSAAGQNLNIIIAPDAGTSQSFAGTITDNVNGGSANHVGLILNGLGTQILTGTNSYSGGTTIDAGTLQLGSANSLPSSTVLNFGGSGTLNLNGFSPVVAGLSVAAGATANVSGGTLQLGNNATILINDSVASTITLNGALNISGATIDASGASGAASGWTIVINSLISGNGGLVLKGLGATQDNGGSSSTFTLTNTNTFTGGVNIASGMVNVVDGDGIFGNGSVPSTNAVTIAAGAGIENAGGSLTSLTLNSTFMLNGAGNHYFRGYGGTTTTIANGITDGGTGASLYKIDSGTLVLQGSNSYTGVTQVNDGMVVVLGNESAATGGWAIGTASQYASTVELTGGSTINVSSGSAIKVGTLPGNSNLSSAQQVLLALSSMVTNAGALSIGSFGSVNLSGGATWTQTGAINIQPTANNSTGAATLIVGSGAVFSYSGTSPIGLTPSLNSSGGTASLQISGGTFNTSQGFTNAASFSAPATTNSSGGTAVVAITSGGTLTLLNNISSLTSTNGSNFKLTVDSGSGGTINTNGFNTSVTSVISDANSGGILNKAGAGTLTLAAANAYSGGTNIIAGTLAFAAPGALPIFSSLTVGAGALAMASPSTGVKNTLFVSSLSLAGSTGNWTGTLDLANNDLVVRGGNLATLTNQVAQGYANGHWNGTGGIVSSMAAADSIHLTALGVIQNSVDQNGGNALMGMFDGQSVNNTDILVKYTYYGDTNLDGKVDGSDYARIDAAYLADQEYLAANSGGTALPATGWFNGDFNYDGVVDGSDYTLMDNAFNQQGAQLAAQVAFATAQITGAGGASAVPEPATLGVIGMITVGALGRRRRASR
jgi:fibronectin-binding autotransporter adhesin